MTNEDSNSEILLTDIAIIGMSCRFPGANNLEEFWSNLVDGRETISRFSKTELSEAGISNECINAPGYVPAKGILDNVEKFDARFFGYNPNDAKMTDPQHRLFLECAWEALESAAYTSEKYDGLIAVYASMADSLYLQNNLLKNKEIWESSDWFQIRSGNSTTALSTQISYRLNLTGPSVNIGTACSSALVAIATACRSLVDYECDIAIAGGVAIAVPQKSGYLYQPSGIESPDGHCRAFDASAKGTVFSNGLGVVVLKRLQDALQDNDTIYAVIKGWNVNNDGSDKLGFTAPSIQGQAKCIASALALSDINPNTLSYVEAHGTATELGDVIELQALTNAFSAHTKQKQFCAIGSVKTNIGHTDIASGMASFIKTVLSLKNKCIPATLHYHQANPKINFPNTPFFVNDLKKEWNFGVLPRRAGVNASGIGGTNAFLILEEHEQSNQKSSSRNHQLLLLSAKTENALEAATLNLACALENNPGQMTLADVAYTLQVGRTDFNYRRAIVCRDISDAISRLKSLPKDSSHTRNFLNKTRTKVVFLFPGQGSQYIGMAKNLYNEEPKFAQWVDHCCQYLERPVKQSVMDFILNNVKNNEIVGRTNVVQPALFIIEYSIAKYLMELGVQPDAMIGHSLGEYVAACLAKVLSLKDALKLIYGRAQLMAKTSGSMLAVSLSKDDLLPFIEQKNISIAAINSSTNCVISGDVDAIDALEKTLQEHTVFTRKLRTAHAFHSSQMDPIIKDFRTMVDEIDLKMPKIPFISNVTGDWITGQEVVHSDYWVNHLRYTVYFEDGLKKLVRSFPQSVFVEIGPGRTLYNFVKELIKKDPNIDTLNTLPGSGEPVSDQECFLAALGKLWLHGATIDWKPFYQAEKRQRVCLPSYPFERQSYWISPSEEDKTIAFSGKKPYPQWFYEPSWERSSLPFCDDVLEKSLLHPSCWILLCDDLQVGNTIFDLLNNANQRVIKVKNGLKFSKLNSNEYTIRITHREDFQSLVEELSDIFERENLRNSSPLRIINLFPLTPLHNINQLDLNEVKNITYLSFYSTLFLVQALTGRNREQEVTILIVGNEIFSVMGTENIYPAKATAVGPCRVIPLEYTTFSLRILDILLSDFQSSSDMRLFCKQIIIDALFTKKDVNENMIAHRGPFRWTQVFRPLELIQKSQPKLKDKGVYFFTGGLGGIGLTLAKYIAKTIQKPTFIMLTHTLFPEQKDWQTWLKTHEQSDVISKKIIQLMEIKNLGAEINIFKENIENFNEVAALIKHIHKNIGTINGVVHAAGVSGGGLVQLKTVEFAETVLHPKVEGTYVLTHLLKEEPLDFFLLCSSVITAINKLGQIDYTAANACLDAFIHTEVFKNKSHWMSLNWNTWREVGMAVESPNAMSWTHLDEMNTISPDEGVDVFISMISNHYKQAIVSTLDINTLRMMDNEKKSEGAERLIKRENILEGHENYMGASNPTEHELVKIWQTILGIEGIGVEDDFIELGGHSLMMLRLLSQCEKQFQVKINLQTLYENKTIKDLAKKIKTLDPNQNTFSSAIVTIRLEGKRRPLFCFHPVGGTVFCYMNFSKYLKFDCPIYAVQDPAIEQGEMLFRSIPEMASYYIKAIKQIQKHGPYLLCGLSFGGALAVEIAKQLHQSGESITALILFDAWAKFSNIQFDEKIFKETMLLQSFSVDMNFTEQSWKRMLMLLNYEISEIKDRIILFKAETLLPKYKDINQRANYWDKYSKQRIDVYTVPGDHETILEEPNVSVLAEKLDTVLFALHNEVEHENS